MARRPADDALTMPGAQIIPVRKPDDLSAAIALFREYAASLDIDLGYQDFEGEMAAMPGKYAPPRGELLLARLDDGNAAGCVGLRPIEPDGCCEMKRLYVAPAGRGAHLGESLVAEIVAIAERAGYREMRLDTLPTMAAAISLYRKFGFETMPPYYDTPIEGTLFRRRVLNARV
jgi:ribosomal protein S18 acetylase RimI-like enzyme